MHLLGKHLHQTLIELLLERFTYFEWKPHSIVHTPQSTVQSSPESRVQVLQRPHLDKLLYTKECEKPQKHTWPWQSVTRFPYSPKYNHYLFSPRDDLSVKPDEGLIMGP